MTVRAIRLENFMAFADTGWIDLRPISLLFGRNSSGKSAIIRALRLLKQSRTQPPDALPTQFPLNFFREHGLDQGSFENTVNLRPLEVAEREQDPSLRDERQRIITFHLRCGLEGHITDELLAAINRYLETIEQPTLSPDDVPDSRWADLSLGFARSYDQERNDWQVELVQIEASCSWPTLASKLILFWTERTGWVDREVDEGSDREWQWLPDWLEPYSDVVFGDDWGVEAEEPADLLSLPVAGFLEPLREPLQQHLWNETRIRQSTGLAFLIRLLAEMAKVIYEFLRNMQYLGPVRPEPERLYRFNAVDAAIWREQGWGSYLDFLSLKLPDTNLFEQIGEWFDYLDLGPTIQPDAVQLGRGFLSEISVYEEKDGVPFNLRDVGFGGSQVLPVIVHSLLARPGTLVIIEQPELHLHPAAQAQLGDIFAEAIYTVSRFQDAHGKSRESFSLNRVHFLLETHSEHLLLRLQSRVAETFATQDKVLSVIETSTIHEEAKRKRKAQVHLAQKDFDAYLVTRQNGVSRATMLELSEDGDFINTPPTFDDFFADDLLETVALAKARNRFFDSGDDND